MITDKKINNLINTLIDCDINDVIFQGQKELNMALQNFAASNMGEGQIVYVSPEDNALPGAKCFKIYGVTFNLLD